jgi:Flp pilus assembly protein TadD
LIKISQFSHGRQEEWSRGGKRNMEALGINHAITESEYLVRQAQERAMTGDHFTAVSYLKQALDTYSKNAHALTLLGNCQDCLDNVKHAIESYDKALQIDPDDAETWFNKGMSLKKIGQINEATQCFEKCMDLNFW